VKSILNFPEKPDLYLHKNINGHRARDKIFGQGKQRRGTQFKINHSLFAHELFCLFQLVVSGNYLTKLPSLLGLGCSYAPKAPEQVKGELLSKLSAKIARMGGK
jgi:hypothetical protein